MGILIFLSYFPIYCALQILKYSNLNDDTYITLTYVKNLVIGKGFMINHAPETLGTTTPLLTFFLAGIKMLLPWFSIETIAVYFTAACWIGIAWTFWFSRDLWKLDREGAVIIGAAILGINWLNFFGMEAFLFSLILILDFVLFYSERWFWSGLLTGLLFLTRGEGILILVIYFLILIWQIRCPERVPLGNGLRKLGKLMVGFVIPVSLWSVYAFIHFHSILPNTLLAKQAQLQNGLGRYFLVRLFTEWLPNWGNTYAMVKLPYINIWWLFVSIGFIGCFLIYRRWLILLLWMLVYIVGYSLVGVSAYAWYQLPIIFVLQLLFGLGLVILTKWLSSLHIKPLFAKLMSIGLLLFVLSIQYFSTFQQAKKFVGDLRGPSYRNLSEWLVQNTQDTDSVAYGEIGYLSYFTNNRIIDLFGLINPEIITHVRNSDFVWGFIHYQPDYYIYLSDFDWALRSIKNTPFFINCYRPLVNLKGPREADFIIYKRQNCGSADSP